MVKLLILIRSYQHHLQMMGGSHVRVCKTGKPGTRQTRGSPAQSRHCAGANERPFGRLCDWFSGGLADPITDGQ
jgi:hypothetical protein